MQTEYCISGIFFVSLHANKTIMVRKIFLCMSIVVLSLAAHADLLQDILDNRFAAQTLSAEELDSVLNGKPVWTDDEALLPQNRYVLKYDKKEGMFRRSFVANYYVMDTKKNEKTAVSDTLVRDAQMSPNGQYVVYGRGQNLYIYKVLYKTEVAITKETDDIFSGVSDWLYEEEFGVTRLFRFSPDSKKVAYVRLDERHVPTFTFQHYLHRTYPANQSLRYPRAGRENGVASVCVYDISTKAIQTMKLPAMEDGYIPRLYWRNEEELIIERINRDQNKMEVWSANAKSTVCTPLYTESSDRYYVDYALFDQWQWLSDGRFITLSEKNGWRQLYLYSAQGMEQQVLTPAGIDVTAVYGVDEKASVVYYEAAPSPEERQVYAVGWKKGTPVRLTEEKGIHQLTLSEDKTKAVDCYQSETCPNRYTLYDVKGNRLVAKKVLLDNADILEAWNASGLLHKQFIRIPTERGDTLDAWTILPQDLSIKHPVVIMQYSGPASQTVKDGWRHRFGHYLASQGYVVINADPRGTDCRGRAWRNETYMNLGKKEAEDHLSVAHYAQSLPYVDGNRIAMIGWSYGGFQTIRTMMEQETALIKCGIAIAPVTDWRLYDSGYTERFMRRPQVNESGYETADLTKMADRLTGQLLLVHSTGDDNVHFQNTLLLSDALIRAGKQFDTQLYVDDTHSLTDKANKRHLHDKIMLYLQQHL